MTVSKPIPLVLCFILVTPLVTSCVPAEHQCKEYRKIAEEWLGAGEKSKIGDALAERIKGGASLADFLPPTGVLVAALMVPIMGIAGTMIVLILLLALYHRRTMAMIAKGSFEQKPLAVRWDLLVLLTGLILIFLGPAISIYLVSAYGVYPWAVSGGVIPFFLGGAFLVFHKMYLSKQ